MEGSPASLLYEWQAYYELDPFGQEREDIRTALICQKIFQAAGVKKKGGGDFKLDEFMISFDKKQETSPLDPLKAQAILRQRYDNNSKPRR